MKCSSILEMSDLDAINVNERVLYCLSTNRMQWRYRTCYFEVSIYVAFVKMIATV